MRRALFITTLFLFLFTQAALAASVAGKWSGTMTVNGKHYDTTVRFTSSGSFSATARDITVTGSYSISGNKVRMRSTVFNFGVSVSLKLKEKSGRQVLSGSASESGKDGTITLSRKTPADSQDEPEGSAAYGGRTARVNRPYRAPGRWRRTAGCTR